MIKPINQVCCFPLESFVKWFGYIQAGCCTLGVIMCIYMIMSYDEVIADVAAIDQTETAIASEKLLVSFQTTYLVLLVYFALGVGFSYLLVMAVNRRNQNFLLPWLISNAISTCLFLIALSPVILPMIILLTPMVLAYYIYYGILSLYLVLKDEQGERINSSSIAPTQALSPTNATVQYTN